MYESTLLLCSPGLRGLNDLWLTHRWWGDTRIRRALTASRFRFHVPDGHHQVPHASKPASAFSWLWRIRRAPNVPCTGCRCACREVDRARTVRSIGALRGVPLRTRRPCPSLDGRGWWGLLNCETRNWVRGSIGVLQVVRVGNQRRGVYLHKKETIIDWGSSNWGLSTEEVRMVGWEARHVGIVTLGGDFYEENMRELGKLNQIFTAFI